MKRLKQLRQERKLSQEVIALIIGVNRSAISQIENGKQEIYAHQIKALCVGLAISADWLLGTSDLE